ncbi:antiviral RADAR system adenosine triphosphatase RdrA [Pseudomonas inefficax]|uniref:antiviral RADAR system adenosine triphosphatase RdrA n=1 Tax=Pseudomonas putida TaxID=303 RepID=UPI002E7CA4C0|nr:antiviral RADAR system adenosine triphosphatase RdrA [Pseudomonas inefficax]MEE1909061.1 antiviral RADAR system adenosine triphosphatase RdrA [Pseudomonas inefficax]MEE1985059.1 antiviral RADAR system adenosine triphosphatase RdrA [Pseudomonas inefficax]
MSSEQGQDQKKPIYFPLDQGERAGNLTVSQLLPRKVYEKLAEMLSESCPTADWTTSGDDSERFERDRGHTTIFLDGDRGTGKTTVIVNLPKYLEADGVRERYAGLADAVHILKPIDPSQLEDGDDLFLNVVVAAVLGDKQVKEQRGAKPDLWQALHESLQTLGIALAGKETQSDGVGLDRLRAFMGTQELAGAVHDFFIKAAQLLGKKLLVLPIDDVDTTLHRAFENLEVVRRYLASPVILPIVCGDLSLYREVTWRDAFRRLTIDVVHYHDQAKPIAEDLAHEYLRKILPLHRRLRMPQVGEFLEDYNVFLGADSRSEGTPRLTLPELADWLRALLSGPVNDHENSLLRIPIPTVRALSQLLSRVRTDIQALEKAYFNETSPLPETDLMRRISYRRRGLIPARRHTNAPELSPPATELNQVSLEHWQSALLNHFMFEPSAGAVCLVLLALRHWHEAAERSVLDTPLFLPLRQITRPELRYIETRAKLAWGMDLSGRLPESWVSTLKDQAILPFATPEVGRAVVPTNWDVSHEPAEDLLFSERARVLIELIAHHNFYSSSKRATLICSGRVLELVVTSLVRDISSSDINRILANAPFHSAVRVAATKAVRFSIDDIELSEFDADGDSASGIRYGVEDLDLQQNRGLVIEELVTAINEWRRSIHANRLPRSPWLVYCALNKAFNQAPLFIRPLGLSEQPKGESLSDVAASGLSAFNSFWAALASFEKGPLFDLSTEISNVNLLKRTGDFSQNNLYIQNIKPLVEREVEHATVFGEQVISTTWALGTHPLRSHLQALFEFAKARDEETVPEPEETDGRKFLLRSLGLSTNVTRLTIQAVKKALRRNAPRGVSSARFGESVMSHVSRKFPELSQLGTLRQAIDELENENSSSGPA